MKATVTVVEARRHEALQFLLHSLSVCAYSHALSRQLLDRFGASTGQIAAICPPWISAENVDDFARGTQEPPNTGAYNEGSTPQAVLVQIIQRYLREDVCHIVVCENFGWERKHLRNQPWPPPHVVCWGDSEVFHVVPADMLDPEDIEASIVARHHWQTGVCSACARMPGDEIADSYFVEEIVEKTAYVFVPAFDGSGYLMWCPTDSLAVQSELRSGHVWDVAT